MNGNDNILNPETLLNAPLKPLAEAFPPLHDFLEAWMIPAEERSFRECVAEKNAEFFERRGCSPETLSREFLDFIAGVQNTQKNTAVTSLTILPGRNKSGAPETTGLDLHPGEVCCIAGPTGSGKSRLLSDIEWLADGDSPTGRRVLINGKRPDEKLKRRFGGKLVSQITQNMNFVLDMNVEDFLEMHAQSQFWMDSRVKVEEVMELANRLSGESFARETPVTSLSGGQSRALMIADVACLGKAPVVLIDEIENAGVNKRKALELLSDKRKIVLMATHDPLLMLQAERRVIIRNGGMEKICVTSPEERELLLQLEAWDEKQQQLRDFFRGGGSGVPEGL